MRTLQLNIALESVFQYDSETDSYIVWYKQFPEAFAQGKTKEEAENNLIPTLELMWQERKEDLQNKLREQFITEAHHAQPKIVSE